MKSTYLLSIATLALAGCQAETPASSLNQSRAAAQHRQVYSCSAVDNADRTMLTLSLESVAALGNLSDASTIYLNGREGWAELATAGDVDGITTPGGSALYHLKNWGDGDTDFYFAALPKTIAANRFGLSIFEKSDQIGHLVTVAYNCSETINAPLTARLQRGSALTCGGDVTTTGDYADVQTTWLSATQIGASVVQVSTEYGIDDPAPYTMPKMSASDDKLVAMQKADKIDFGDLTVDFNKYDCFDFSEETTQSSLVFMCLPKGSAGKKISSLKPLIIDDIVNGDGYVSAVEGSCSSAD